MGLFFQFKLNWWNGHKRKMINELLKGKNLENCMMETKAFHFAPCLTSYQMDNMIGYGKSLSLIFHLKWITCFTYLLALSLESANKDIWFSLEQQKMKWSKIFFRSLSSWWPTAILIGVIMILKLRLVLLLSRKMESGYKNDWHIL